MTALIDTVATAGVIIAELPPRARFSLRLRPENLGAASAALNLALSERIGSIAVAGNLRALCLGPDEWLMQGPEGVEIPALPSDLPHALVDISDREIAYRISGPRAAELLSIGIARNLTGTVPGTGRRTAFDSVQAILVRETEEIFTLLVWRSFAAHTAELLAIGQRELASGL